TLLADLDESDLEKRAEEAQKRMALSKNLIRVEEKAKKPYVRSHAALSPEELKKKIKAFYDISEKAENVEKDDTFVKNLAENYALCDIADNMKRWIAEASEGGYLPKDANLVEIEKRIARFSQLKQFLDAQSALMKNPYYCYLKDEDVSYTSKQLDEIFESTKDDTLKDYLTHLKTLRSLSFSRKKGLKSTTETAEQMAKREVELLSTKAEKRGILERLSDEALHFHSQERFTDPNYERKFTRAVFEKALIHFDALKITDLHFKNLKDMTDNFAANKEYFTQAREMEQLLAWAVSHKMSPPDEQLIPLRAKIAAFTRLEELAHTMQHTVVCAKDIDNITIGELVSEAESLCQDHAQKGGYGEVPRLGLDLFKFEKAIRKSYL
ncbi:MAG: hypothetical protein IJ521_12165, partial [Schwartzia sp.]|nr:hypothetical protein [Schwartzia sp. (in: firmicutes)]